MVTMAGIPEGSVAGGMKSHAEGHFNEVNLDSDGKSVLLQWDR